ncbi:hypothetical protein CLAIMM_12417 isoform 2 [Cladophialophora immunda]|nr:hypothetical protein CLAIMM_12417 isoform 2 [Cladophialophora immunda]
MGSIQETPGGTYVPHYAKITRFSLSSDDPADFFEVHNPATGEVITTVAGCGEKGVEKAVAIAQKAFDDLWRWKTPKERSELLLRAADHLAAHSEELAYLLSMENGKPVTQARQADITFVVNIYRFFGSLVDKLPSELYDQGSIYSSIIHEPYGVVAGILPFNWPAIHCGGKSAPALAAGNTIILKPGEQAPLTVMRIVELVSEVLPPGVIQALPAAGTNIPAKLVSHPTVKKISFTGSTRGGAAEMFGPIVTVNVFDTYEEAISIANEPEYGLVTAIFTQDTTKALRAARDIDVGMVFINNYTRMALGTPFGGAKHSGYGREHCIETLREYSRPKSIRIPTGRAPIPGWTKLGTLFEPLPKVNGAHL